MATPATTNSADVFNLFIQIVTDIWHKYGPFAALLILLVVAYEWRMMGLWKARLSDKDQEVERLVRERDRLLDAILKKRLSSKG